MQSAASAFTVFSQAPAEQVSNLLENIALEIELLGDELIEAAISESNLPEPRIRGETARTTGQLRQFSALVSEGSWMDARLDVGGGTGRDIRRVLRPLGPAVIFGASNFPLAFSVAGGDTAAALAARCPVVHKVHPAHPHTCMLVGQAISRAVALSGLPSGVFSMVHGVEPNVGQQLVEHSATRVGGFTGSLTAGRALFDIANKRPIPIPFYAEMGSVNPVVILPGALGSKLETIAAGLASSVTLGVGQFCTNPGIVFVTAPTDVTAVSTFVSEVARNVDCIPSSDMLTKNIGDQYVARLATLVDGGDGDDGRGGGVTVKTSRGRKGISTVGGGVVLHVSGEYFLGENNAVLQEEIFGPSTLIVEFKNEKQLLEGIQSLQGQLTATVWGSSNDLKNAQEIGILQSLSERAGRVLFNGFPTGVEVCSSMVHGGPYPAATIDETSVGMESIRRFCRPVCYQDCPDSLLPPELQDLNPRGIFRKVNDEYTTGVVAVEEFSKKQVV